MGITSQDSSEYQMSVSSNPVLNIFFRSQLVEGLDEEELGVAMAGGMAREILKDA